MAYEVPPLPYGYDSLEPDIDEQTMRIHHDKHHQAYVDKANAALEGTEWADKPVEDVLANLSSLPADKQGPVRNNAGGHANHSLFWTVLGPNGGGEPSGELADAINSAFGGFDQLKQQMTDAGVNRFGSGWSWLVVDNGGLKVTSTANQDSPLSDGQTPILGIDVWEHAYYLKYQNRRPDYLAAIWNVVDWNAVGERYAQARSAAAAVCSGDIRKLTAGWGHERPAPPSRYFDKGSDVSAKTVVFFPEGAFGPTNNCVGIGEQLRARGHRVVFIVEESFAGTLEARGFEERLMRLGPPPEVEEAPGQFWKDFIRDTAPVFRRATIEQLDLFIAPTFKALIDGA